MATIPQKVYERLSQGIKRFQPILSNAKARDVVEGEKAEEAKKKIGKALSKFSKSKTAKNKVIPDENKNVESIVTNRQEEIE